MRCARAFFSLVFSLPLLLVPEVVTPNQTLAQEGLTLTANPSSGPPGSAPALSGSGFIGNCGINFFFDEIGGTLLGFATVEFEGTFSTQVVIPEDAAEGEHLLVALGLDFGVEFCGDPTGDVAEDVFVVTMLPPSITFDVLEGRPGTLVEINGGGFCGDPECSDVTILINGQVSASEVPVNEDGTLVAQAHVPAIDAAGEVIVVAIQTLASGAERRAFGELIVTVKPDVFIGPE